MALKLWQLQGEEFAVGSYLAAAAGDFNPLVRPIRIEKILAQGLRLGAVGEAFPVSAYCTIDPFNIALSQQPQDNSYVPAAQFLQFLFMAGQSTTWLDCKVELPAGFPYSFSFFANLEAPLAAGESLYVIGSVLWDYMDEK